VPQPSQFGPPGCNSKELSNDDAKSCLGTPKGSPWQVFGLVHIQRFCSPGLFFFFPAIFPVLNKLPYSKRKLEYARIRSLLSESGNMFDSFRRNEEFLPNFNPSRGSSEAPAAHWAQSPHPLQHAMRPEQLSAYHKVAPAPLDTARYSKLKHAKQCY
jgi:hypothetical protein